jgi:hypothetical protein
LTAPDLAAAGLEACAAGAAPPVLHIRGDALGLMLAVVAAARAWAHGGGEEALRLADTVSAYEAALPPGAA